MIEAIYIVYMLLFVVEALLLIQFWVAFKQVSIIADGQFPSVSVLVCARNEELNLRDCLNSLITLDYPQNRIEILVGNDNSEDNTAEIIREFESEFKHIKGVDIEFEKEGLIAKGNVLNQLIDQARYKYQVIIDADMIVTPKWLTYMVSALVDGNDMVSGHTQIRSSNWLTNLQLMDWQIVLHTMKVMADTVRPISILGNNMAFKKKAYDQVGGFRGLGPTDVEDLGLLQQFQKKGLNTIQLINSKGFAYTKPQLTFNELLTQRCRWMNGVFTHHFVLGIPALFARLWVVFASITACFDLTLGALIMIYGLLMNWGKSRSMTLKTRSSNFIFIFEPIIISLLDTLALLRLVFVGKVSWKGRKY